MICREGAHSIDSGFPSLAVTVTFLIVLFSTFSKSIPLEESMSKFSSVMFVSGLSGSPIKTIASFVLRHSTFLISMLRKTGSLSFW